MLTGLVFGLVPALQSTKFDIRESLNEEGRGGSRSLRHRRLREALVVVETALALMLLVGAGLLLRSYAALTRVSTGFNTEKLLVVNLPLSPLTYRDATVRTAVVERIVERVRALPSVQAAAMTTMLPMAGAGARYTFIARRSRRGPDEKSWRAIARTPGYLSALGAARADGCSTRDIETRRESS